MDQKNLFLTSPLLYLSLAIDRVSHILERLIVDKPVALVALGKAFDQALFVITSALADVIRHSDIDHAGAAGDDVNVKVPVARQRSLLFLKFKSNTKTRSRFLASLGMTLQWRSVLAMTLQWGNALGK